MENPLRFISTGFPLKCRLTSVVRRGKKMVFEESET